jgi:hypothetical protein
LTLVRDSYGRKPFKRWLTLYSIQNHYHHYHHIGGLELL